MGLLVVVTQGSRLTEVPPRHACAIPWEGNGNLRGPCLGISWSTLEVAPAFVLRSLWPELGGFGAPQ